MAARSSRYNLNEVLGLLDDDNLDDFGLVESGDSACDQEEIGSYLPEVQPEDQMPDFSEEEELEMDNVHGPGKILE